MGMIILRKARGGRFFPPRAKQVEKFLQWFTALQAIMLSCMSQITRQVTYLCDGSNLPKKQDLLGKGDPRCEFCLELHVLRLQRVSKS